MDERNDRELIEPLRALWGRPVLDAGEQRAFDAALERRIAPRPHRALAWLVPVTAAVAAVAVAWLWLTPPATDPADPWLAAVFEADAAVVTDVDVSVDGTWLGWLTSPEEDAGLAGLVPAEYVALALWTAPPSIEESSL